MSVFVRPPSRAGARFSSAVVWVMLAGAVLPSGSAGGPSQEGRNRALAERAVRQIVAGENLAQAVAQLHWMGEEAFASARLREKFTLESSLEARRRFVEALASLADAQSEPLLVRLCQDSDPVLRMHAVAGLGRMRSRHSEAALRLVTDSNPGVRRQAAEAVGRMGRRADAGALIAAARSESEPEVRAALLFAVGDCHDGRQQAALEAFLKHSSESTRFAAARALCRLGAASGAAYAGRLLRAKDVATRRQGLALYEGVSTAGAQAVVRPLLEDAEPALAAMAARILHQGGAPGMLEWLVERSALAPSAEARLAYETELEPLLLTDAERKAILRRKGLAR